MSELRFDCRFQYRGGFALDFAFVTDELVTALVGPSGSGKSTVLNLIAGVLTPRDGVIRLGGSALFDSAAGKNLPPERRSIGYVFQDYQLFPHLSAAENLRYGQRRSGTDPAEFDRVVATLKLGDLLQQAPATLSGGEKQRVALGRALLRDPQLLLLDEPLGALDVELRASITEHLRRALGEFRTPTILVSHDPASVASLASAVVALPRPESRPAIQPSA